MSVVIHACKSVSVDIFSWEEDRNRDKSRIDRQLSTIAVLSIHIVHIEFESRYTYTCSLTLPYVLYQPMNQQPKSHHTSHHSHHISTPPSLGKKKILPSLRVPVNAVCVLVLAPLLTPLLAYLLTYRLAYVYHHSTLYPCTSVSHAQYNTSCVASPEHSIPQYSTLPTT